MSSTLAPQDLKALEQLRQRLSQLTNSISTLQRDLQNSETLPPWPHLTSLLSIISSNLSAVADVQSSQRALLASLAVYPLPAYPGRSEEGLLEQLLRKKLEPGVEDWVERGRDAGLAATRAANTSTATATGEQPQPQMSRDELREIWAWAGGAANEQARAHPWGGDFTREEVEQGVEGVQTGLRRKLRAPGEDESSDEDDDEDEDEDMEDVAEVGVRRKSTAEGQGLEFDILKETGGKGEGKPMPLAQQWRFMLTGQS